MIIKYRPLLGVLVAAIIITSCNNRNRNREITEQYFNTIKREGDNAKLAFFFTQMPKGGDLHHHYSGALYVETYLELAKSGKLRVNAKTFMFDNDGISIDSLEKNTALYRGLLQEWSDADYSNNFHLQGPPDLHFFHTFPYFIKIASDNCRAGLAEIKEEAKKENVQYIETMLNFPQVAVQCRQSLIDSLVSYQNKQDTTRLYQIFSMLAQSVKSEPSYDKTIADYLDSLHSYHAGIDDSDFTMRFQAYGLRTLPPDHVFAMLYACFDAAARDKSSLLVGVNIVAPENDYVSMHDYWLHMQMFRFLKRRFTTVKTALHAGELCMGMVKPQDLTYHIHDAVFIANANRIGHGVDMPYETEAPEILKRMKGDSIAVEINLSSNEFILGVKGTDHPINLYNDAGVPVVISTDDAGVSRNNLTSQYVLLASRYHFTYSQIKSFVYNSIEYSFLKKSEKAALEEKLNRRFDVFEAKIASEYCNWK
ncbi:MAG TPA: adenosine deaminase [Bacteroidia bacterium]|jgi:adenosine deaminase|nr:adenosine deaminase [Bacteroidia bacterium]